MRSLVLCTAILLVAFSPVDSSARWKTVLVDEFSQEQGWPDHDAEVDDGIYLLEPDVDEGERGCWTKNTELNTANPYRIETRIRRTPGKSTNTTGFLWETSGGCDNALSLFISLAGEIQIGYFKDGVYFYYGWQDNAMWKKTSTSRPEGEWNDIVIERRSTYIQFSINGEIIRRIEPFKFQRGSGVGYITYGPNSLEVDYVKIYEDTSSINVVPGALTQGERVNLGLNINSPDWETLPIITSDAKTLYITSRPVTNGATDDIFYSTFENGNWTPRKNIGPPLNNTLQNSAIAVSADGNSLLLNGISRNGQYYDLSRSYKAVNGWSEPTGIAVKDFINSAGSYSASLSSDGRVIFWGIQDATSIGGRDIYVSFLQSDGSWSRQMNVGPEVNTFADEGTPYLAADGETLYFSSDGHKGYGSSDVFVTRRLDNTYRKWSKPQNLGSVVNTDDWDAYFKIDASGDYGVLCSVKDAIGGTDVFKIKLPNAAKPKPLVLLNATVLDKKTKAPLAAAVRYFDLTTNAELGVARTDPMTGSFRLTMPYGARYAFLASADGYYATSDTIITTAVTEFTEVTCTMMLSPVAKGETITLSNIFFETDKSTLLSESYPSLDRLVQFMQERPQIRIAIMGHTDNVGTDQYNTNLSDARAKAVAEYLRSKSIDAARFTAKGFGESKPIATNDTEEGRQQNRRVEFTIETM